MFHESVEDFMNNPGHAIMLVGMSGVGKTRFGNLMRASGGWFHYSVDYRIGTRYLGEAIADNVKREAMRVPFLRDLLLSDSVKIRPNIRFDHLKPLASYLGKPGDPERGGIPFEEYLLRQRQHREAETRALVDAIHFRARAQALYGYPHFLGDSSGSIIELVDPDDPGDALMARLAPHFLFLHIDGGAAHEKALRERFDADPKPMYYDEAFLRDCWRQYEESHRVAPENVDPDDFARQGFAALLRHRTPRYRAFAKRWGYSIPLDAAARATSAEAFLRLVQEAVAARLSG